MASQTRVVVVGSLHYDIVVEAPHRPAAGETVTGEAWFPKFGGKGGNQAVAAAKAGAPTVMLSAVGEDDFATFLLAGLAQGGVETDRVVRVAGVGSGMSVAIKDATGDYGAVIVSGSNLEIPVDAVSDPTLWTGAGALILQNEVPEAINIEAGRAAHTSGARVILNAAPFRPMSPALLELVDVLVVNALEAEALCEIAVTDLDSAARAAQALNARFPVAVVTAGGDGVAVAQGGAVFSHPAEPVELVSTHGAGDCFVGTLTKALIDGQGVEAAVLTANKAAARHVSRRD